MSDSVLTVISPQVSVLARPWSHLGHPVTYMSVVQARWHDVRSVRRRLARRRMISSETLLWSSQRRKRRESARLRRRRLQPRMPLVRCRARAAHGSAKTMCLTAEPYSCRVTRPKPATQIVQHDGGMWEPGGRPSKPDARGRPDRATASGADQKATPRTFGNAIRRSAALTPR